MGQHASDPTLVPMSPGIGAFPDPGILMQPSQKTVDPGILIAKIGDIPWPCEPGPWLEGSLPRVAGQGLALLPREEQPQLHFHFYGTGP